MKNIFLFVFTLVVINVYSQKQIYAIPDLKSTISQQKIVAILPFPTSITYRKQPKNFSEEANRQQEIKMAQNIQTSLYTFLLRKANKYTVTFQDVDKTNILLKKAGIADKLNEVTKDEIAKILGVDAIISGKFEQEHSRTEAGAITTTILFGSYGSKTGSGTLTMTINNGTDGELLWRFMNTMDDTITTSTDDLIERMMRKVARNFPYTK